MFPFFVDYFNTMACYARLARLPVGHGLNLNQPTKRDGQKKNRKRKPKKGNDKISSKSQKKTTGGARMPSDRSARDSVQAHRPTRDLSKSVPRKELTMADRSIADTSSKFSKESPSSSYFCMRDGGGDCGGSLAAAWQQRQLGGGGCSSLAAAAWWQQLGSSSSSVAAVAAVAVTALQ